MYNDYKNITMIPNNQIYNNQDERFLRISSAFI